MERRGRVKSRNMYKGPMDIDNSVGIDCGSGGLAGVRKAKGEKLEQL